MKILRIVYDWPPPWDGLAPAPYEMTTSQVKLGHSVEVFCGRWLFAGALEIPQNTKVTAFFREPIPGFLNITTSVLLFFYYLFWRRKNRPHVIHSHGHFAIWIYAYRNFLKKFFPKSKELQIPLVAHFHNTVRGRWEKLEEQGKEIKALSKKLTWPLAERSDMWAIECADACVFVSMDTRNEAIKYYDANASKCFVVETGVNTSLFTPIGPEEFTKTRSELGILPGDKVILNNGAIVERKNVHLLLEALKFLPRNFKLLLVGPPGEQSYEEKLRQVISENHLKDRVIRVGYTPYPEVQIAFQAADIFVLPSEWEGLPKVVLQSLACGVPALASGFEAQKEVKGLFYLKDLNPQNIANQIQEIISQDSYVDIGFVRANYSWDLMAKKVEQIYNRLLK